MKVVRIISKFRKSGELVSEINVDFIPIEKLREIFVVKNEDHDMYFVYEIGPKEAQQIKSLTKIQFDLEAFNYQLDCFQKA